MKELNGPNIRFGIIERDINEDGCRMGDFTSVFIVPKDVSEETIRLYAEILIGKGCRDFAFCGEDSDRWHNLFDDVDIQMSNCQEDYSDTWSINSIGDLPDELNICNENVFVFCEDETTVRKCHTVIVDAGYGFKVRYIGPEEIVAFTKNKVYSVLSIEKGMYRVLSELDEDYLIPPEACEEV